MTGNENYIDLFFCIYLLVVFFLPWLYFGYKVIRFSLLAKKNNLTQRFRGISLGNRFKEAPIILAEFPEVLREYRLVQFAFVLTLGCWSGGFFLLLLIMVTLSLMGLI